MHTHSNFYLGGGMRVLLLLVCLSSVAWATDKDCSEVFFTPQVFAIQYLQNQSAQWPEHDISPERLKARIRLAGSDGVKLESLANELASYPNGDKTVGLTSRWSDVILALYRAGHHEKALEATRVLLTKHTQPLIREARALLDLTRELAEAGADIEKFGLVDAFETHLQKVFAYPIASWIQHFENNHELELTQFGRDQLEAFYKSKYGQWIGRGETVEVLQKLQNRKSLKLTFELDRFPDEDSFFAMRDSHSTFSINPEGVLPHLSGSARSRFLKITNDYYSYELKLAIVRRQLLMNSVEASRGVKTPLNRDEFLIRAREANEHSNVKHRWDYAQVTQRDLVQFFLSLSEAKGMGEFTLAHLHELYPSPSALDVFEVVATASDIEWTLPKVDTFVQLWAEYAQLSAEHLFKRFQGFEPRMHEYTSLDLDSFAVKDTVPADTDFRELHFYNRQQFLRAIFMLKNAPHLQHQARQMVSSLPEGKVFKGNRHGGGHPLFHQYLEKTSSTGFSQSAFKGEALLVAAEYDLSNANEWIEQAEHVLKDRSIVPGTKVKRTLESLLIAAYIKAGDVEKAKNAFDRVGGEPLEDVPRLRALLATHLPSRLGIPYALSLLGDMNLYPTQVLTEAFKMLWGHPELRQISESGLLQVAARISTHFEAQEFTTLLLESPLSLADKDKIMSNLVRKLIDDEEHSLAIIKMNLQRIEGIVQSLLARPELTLTQETLRSRLRPLLEQAASDNKGHHEEWATGLFVMVSGW